MSEFCPASADDKAQESLQVSRREFARLSSLAAACVVVFPSTLSSQETAPKPVVPPSKPNPSTDELSPELRAEGELKYQWVIQKYGSRLSEAQKQDIHRLIMEGQKPLAAFRAFPLDNADQPATVLKFTDVELEAAGGAR